MMQKGKKPDFQAATPVKIGEKTKWSMIGVAFTSPKGTISILLNALPVNGKIVLIKPKDWSDKAIEKQKEHYETFVS